MRRINNTLLLIFCFVTVMVSQTESDTIDLSVLLELNNPYPIVTFHGNEQLFSFDKENLLLIKKGRERAKIQAIEIIDLKKRDSISRAEKAQLTEIVASQYREIEALRILNDDLEDQEDDYQEQMISLYNQSAIQLQEVNDNYKKSIDKAKKGKTFWQWTTGIFSGSTVLLLLMIFV